ncbi:GNAT family N-acetyltransferase [Methylomonas rivi]|uniref:GNAT family N-acetyltransferase n=1 Tax=Methylomonas rivi TaxID=2952226 RepID=A0ABT1U567_9GAMM|nr:GNAT family N-acetyltransferase [Methylomonas sp. WSC-6]MCQ8129001.1 GNAT family N-acetyltransferase [Methylomonas sp. WSC-6]
MQAINDISERHAEVMGLDIRRVTEPAAIETVSGLAGNIWRDHYMPIIGDRQVEYMLNRFQSPAAIGQQIVAGYQYFLLFRDLRPAGYFAWLADTANRSLHISKLYVDKTWQRSGLGSRIIAVTEQYCQAKGLRQIWLTVNRHNRSAIDFYLRNGFLNSGEVVQDIGGGFAMDDYRMVKALQPR